MRRIVQMRRYRRSARIPAAWFRGDDMPIRLRKFIGAIALLVLVMTWALVAMALAQSALTDINGVVAAIYYAVVGLGWVLPAMPIVWWMSKPDNKPDKVKA
jgi:hypothetical protein